MLHCPLRRPLSASKRLPGLARSPKLVAASSWSSLREAIRANPENAAIRPGAVLVSLLNRHWGGSDPVAVGGPGGSWRGYRRRLPQSNTIEVGEDLRRSRRGPRQRVAAVAFSPPGHRGQPIGWDRSRGLGRGWASGAERAAALAPMHALGLDGFLSRPRDRKLFDLPPRKRGGGSMKLTIVVHDAEEKAATLGGGAR